MVGLRPSPTIIPVFTPGRLPRSPPLTGYRTSRVDRIDSPPLPLFSSSLDFNRSSPAILTSIDVDAHSLNYESVVIVINRFFFLEYAGQTAEWNDRLAGNLYVEHKYIENVNAGDARSVSCVRVRDNTHVLLSQAMKQGEIEKIKTTWVTLKDVTSRKYISRFPVMLQPHTRNVYEIRHRSSRELLAIWWTLLMTRVKKFP